MNRSSRSNRFGLTGLRNVLGKRKKSARAAAELAKAAGAVTEQAFESLEARQLLFTLTIDPQSVNPLTGLGTASETFGYFIPYAAATQQLIQVTTTPIEENFDQPDPGPPPSPIASGKVWNQSRVRLDTTGTANFTLVNVDPQGQDFEIRGVVQGGDTFSFSVQPTIIPYALERRGMTRFQFDATNSFDPASYTVDLLFNGQVLRSYAGGALAALGTNLGNGYTNYVLPDPQGLGNPVFDQVRFTAVAGAPASAFNIDNLNVTAPDNPYAAILTSRIFGATVVFSGPAGATAQVFDLYGRDMRSPNANFFANAEPWPGVEWMLGEIAPGFIRGDRNFDGIPEFNDGIGKIVVSGTNVNSALTVFGGTFNTTTGIQPPTFTVVPNPVGLYDNFEAGGFGYWITPGQGAQPPTVHGLPPGPGSVIIGNPFARPLLNYNPAGTASGFGSPSFRNPAQGVFVNGGASIGSVYIHGILFGSSQYTGSVGKLIIGSPMGSHSVNGDLVTFISGGDAAMATDDDGAPTFRSGGELVVGRTVGEIAIGGRSGMNVTVIGELSRPSIFPPRDIYHYFEKEYSPNIGTQPMPVATITGILNSNAYLGQNALFGGAGIFFGRISQQIAFNTGYFRNDSIMAAEWIGTAATAVQINGELGANDPVQTQQDSGDVYAFAVDGRSDIVVDLAGGLFAGALGVYARLVDQDGRTLVATPLFDNDRRTSSSLRYRPDSPGVYYLVVNTRGDGTNTSDLAYVMTVSGMASTTLGAYRTAGGSGGLAPGLQNTINVLSGSVGSMRIGTAVVAGNGAEADPSGIYNMPTGDNTDSSMAFRGSTTSIAGNLYNITTGSDIEGGTVTVNVQGDFGTLITGLSPVIGLGPNNGDLRTFNLTVAGSIASFDIRGALGIDQDPTGFPKAGRFPLQCLRAHRDQSDQARRCWNDPRRLARRRRSVLAADPEWVGGGGLPGEPGCGGHRHLPGESMEPGVAARARTCCWD
jgi:hypothetical protein